MEQEQEVQPQVVGNTGTRERANNEWFSLDTQKIML